MSRVLGLIGRRVLTIIPVLMIVTVGVYALVLLVPGDPAQTLAGGDNATPESLARVREELGLNDPAVVQYLRHLKGLVTFDFGESMVSNRSVGAEMLTRLPRTASVALAGMTFTILIGFAAGIIGGTRAGSRSDRVSIFLATLGISIPSFVVAIFLVRYFSINWKIFPALGYTPITESAVDWMKSIVLPGIALGTTGASAVARQLRSGLVGTLGSDYVRTGWSLGLSRTRVVGRHALRNASIPTVAVLGLQTSNLMSGTIVVESVFSIGGIGTFLYQSVLTQDITAIQGIVFFFVLTQLLLNLLVDVVLSLLDPRIEL